MDPYRSPSSDLELSKKKTPNSILAVYYLACISFIIFIVEELFYILESEDEINEPFNYIFIPIWAAILYWVTNLVRIRKENPKNTFLLLAIVVSSMSIFYPLGAYSIYTGLGEGGCFLCIYYMLNGKTSKEWFE